MQVWIDDPHPIFRRGLAACLQAESFIVAGESSGFSPTPRLDGVDVVLFDLGNYGLRKALRFCEEDVRLVALAREASEGELCEAVESGVAALLLHSDLTTERLATTLRAVGHGAASMPSRLIAELLDRASRSPRNTGRAGLAGREVDVLRLLADGEGTRDIAEVLSYSERTVKNIVHDLLTKMNCRNRAHAVATATRQGLI